MNAQQLYVSDLSRPQLSLSQCLPCRPPAYALVFLSRLNAEICGKCANYPHRIHGLGASMDSESSRCMLGVKRTSWSLTWPAGPSKMYGRRNRDARKSGGIARRVCEMRERASVVTKHHQFVSPVRQIKLPPPWARSLIGEDLGGGLRLRLPVMRLTLPAVTLLAHVVERGDELAQLPFRLMDTLGEFLVDPLKLRLVNAWVIQGIHACNFGHVNGPLTLRVLGPGHPSAANGPHDRGPADPGGVSGLL